VRLGYRARLFTISLVVTLCVVALTGVVLEVLMRGWLEERLSQDLLQRAALVRVALEQSALPARPADVDPLVDGLGTASDAHVRVIDARGQLLGDSWIGVEQFTSRTPPDTPTLLELSQVGPHETYQRNVAGKLVRVLDVVVPLDGAYLRGFARVSLPLGEVDRVVDRVRGMMILASLLGVVVALAMSWIAAHLMSKTLRGLVEHAHTIATRTQMPAPLTPEAEEGEEEEREGFMELDGGSVTRLTRDLEHGMDSLARERDHFRTVLEGMSEGVIALDLHHQITLMNPAAAALLSHEIEALEGGGLGERVTEVLPQPALLDLLEASAEAKPALAELTLPGPPQRRVMVRVSKRKAAPGYVLVMHDVTELRQLETIQRDFVTNVSHELRTPVAVIMANSEALLASGFEDEPRARHFIEGLNRNAERLSRLISDLLDMARMESGKLKLELEPVSVSEAVMLVMDTLEDRAEQRNQELDAEVELGLMVRADAKALDQILYNLIDNAIKYTPDGGRVLVRAALLKDALTPHDAHTVRIEVTDSGPGIPAEHRARVFERFYRVDQGRSRDMGGTGLGLAIVKHLSVAMNGRVGVRANEGTGSVFWVRLPAVDAPGASEFRV
jgi:two-component system, OmpR family, phosphate regulon sensor histidine kinase PhoR